MGMDVRWTEAGPLGEPASPLEDCSASCVLPAPAPAQRSYLGGGPQHSRVHAEPPPPGLGTPPPAPTASSGLLYFGGRGACSLLRCWLLCLKDLENEWLHPVSVLSVFPGLTAHFEPDLINI